MPYFDREILEELDSDIADRALRGEIFHVSAYFTLTSPNTSTFQIKTGAKSAVVTYWSVSSFGELLKVEAKEAPTITDGTVEVTPVNMNRNSTTAPVTKLYSNPTGISGGTLLLVEGVPSQDSHDSGVMQTGTLWILKPNTSYIFVVDPVGDSTTDVAFSMEWYEV